MNLAKVLVVEDDSNWHNLFKIIVANNTSDIFDYVYVTDLKSAVNHVKIDPSLSLILLDLMLPDSSPLNTIQVMTSEAKNAPIVIMTTLDDEKLIADAFVLGVEDYLVKDKYNIGTFIHVCRQAIRRFAGRIVNSLEENIKKIISNLEFLDKKLESWQKINPS